MGIDIYARWKGQTEDEKQAQYTGFSIQAGHVGYLREAYHGDPYATRVLVPEAFDADDEDVWENGAPISAATLRGREDAAVAATKERYRDDPDVQEMATKSIRDFIALCEQKERETGTPTRIIASY